jgi:hypothetical protein
MANEITYRLALELDIDRINTFYNEIYKKHRTHDQFVWEYNSAPAGKSIYVIAEEGADIVGTQCAIPYYIITKSNTEILSAKSEDTLVSPKHRGKHIFENMYKLLIEECKSKGIQFLWGFTYADKPFKKIGFEIPFKSTMGLLTISPFKAANYFYAITSKKNFNSYSKILALSLYSSIKYRLLFLKKYSELKSDTNDINYNTSNINYIKYDNLFGLKLDDNFLNYRIHRNPYSTNYKTINYTESGVLKASLIYNITKENIGYIIQVYFANDLNDDKKVSFLSQAIKQTSLNKSKVIRFWGFNHNLQNREEIDVLTKCNFVFLDRGISFVGLKLNKELEIDFSNFVLSRMASQGTD